MRQKKIIVSVTNDLVSDQRVHKICMFLHNNNFDVKLVGRILSDSIAIERPYKTRRMRLFFTKGAFFYIDYNVRLFLLLLFTKHDYLLSNDLDTLLANYSASRLKKTELIYDSHEYFTEVPELINRPKIKYVWELIEGYIFPKLKTVYTVNESLAAVYKKKYNIHVHSIMNLPYYPKDEKQIKKNEQFTVIYQGALNKDRGLEELICAFEKIENVNLWIVGEGDLSKELRHLVSSLKLNSTIKFWGKIPFSELNNITQQAHLGVSLEKNTNLNYALATPNKLFDYIAAGIPVLTSNLPEIKKIVEEYQIGQTISRVDKNLISNEIENIRINKNQYEIFKSNTKKAIEKLCWENQEEKLKRIFKIK